MLACIQGARLEDTGFSYTMSLIQGKYKMLILYTLMEYGVVRFNEMKKYIGTISYKTLSSTLKELEADGGVQPHGTGQVPDSHPGRHVRLGRGKPPVRAGPGASGT